MARPLPAWYLAFTAMLALVSVLGGGCGFQLQGHTALPRALRAPYLEATDRQSEFVQSLVHQLRVSGSHPVTDRDAATAVLAITQDQFTRRVLAVTAANQPSEYELTYTVRFTVRAGDQELLTEQELTNTRTYSFDERLLLAKGNEETILRQDMARDLADMVLRRLSRL